MLFGPWKESKPANGIAWVVDLRGDSDEALAFILPIIHGKLRHVPHKLDDMGKFASIVVLVDKYAMCSAVSPWIYGWMKHLVVKYLAFIEQECTCRCAFRWSRG
jgi:hypothetical protein